MAAALILGEDRHFHSFLYMSIIFKKCFIFKFAPQDAFLHPMDQHGGTILRYSRNVSSDTMSLIIQYAYARSVLITEENVPELLAAADQF